MYPEEIVKPFKLELTNSGFSELTSSEDVKNALSQSGTTLIVVNSVCGCAASCLLYTSPSPRDATLSRMPSSA